MARKIEIVFDPKSKKLLDELPDMIAVKAIRPQLAKSSKELAVRMKELAPDGAQTGTRQKQSKSAKRRWGKYILKDQIRFTLRPHKKTKGAGFAIAGAAFPGAPKAHFDYGEKALTNGREHILWGKRKLRNRVQKREKHIVLKTLDEKGDKVVRDVTQAVKRLLKA